MTDSMKLLLENTAVPAAYCTKGQEGKAVSIRWTEAIKPRPEKEKTGGEIVAEVVEKGGLVPVFKHKA
ncbi:hypothetical protein D5270_10155 [Acutalibacter sp. 1XD8-36]|nr:hypothetical protein [Acutalibacter sp. 1XD8-36]